MPRVFVAPVEARSIGSVLGLASACRKLSVELQAAVLASAVVETSTVVLGTLSRSSGGERWQRHTTGRSFQLDGRVIWHVLALPDRTALEPDTHAGNWLNRNVRGFLRGYARAGLRAAYTGRDTVNLEHRPALAIGADWTTQGVLLLELALGYERPCCAARRGERQPAAYLDLTAAPLEPEPLIARVHEGLAHYWRAELLDLDLAPELVSPIRFPPFDSAAAHARREVPAGTIEGWRGPDGERVTLATDVLTAASKVREVERRATRCFERGAPVEVSCVEPLLDAPLEGARPDDFWAVLRALSL